MWKLPLLEARISVTGQIDTEIFGIFQDLGKKAISPKGGCSKFVEILRKEEIFYAAHGSVQFIRFAKLGNAENALLLGLGLAEDLTGEKFRIAGGIAWTKLCTEKSKTAVIQVDSFFEIKGFKSVLSHLNCVKAFAEGLILSAYRWDKYKTARDKSNLYFGPARLVFLTHDKGLKTHLDIELARVSAVGVAVNLTRDWSNEPSNVGTPVYYANEAKKVAREHGFKCIILTEQDAAREKMGLFLGVGQGAEREGRFVIVDYTPKNFKTSQNAKTIALVGKGITFDSGGVSIKPAARMEDMKHDMTGAATVMGAVLLAAQWKVPNRVIGIMAFTENMPDGNAIQPGNVLTARNGKTVEIINTDAEGRLILADALDYAQDFKPDAVVNIATLTGAVTVALGKHCCGIFGNEETLIDTLRRAGEANGERIWQLPLFDEYFEDLKSDSADMKNSANDSYGGSIRGAIFLKQFIRKGTNWAHLDIAGTAYNLGHLSYYPKRGASGAHVRTLAQFVADFQ